MAAIFQTTFSNAFSWNENVWISIKISLKFVPKGPINNILALVQMMAWCRPGDKPLSELMLVSLLTHICVIRPQWVKRPSSQHIKAETKWPPFSKQHFPMHFLEWKSIDFNWYLTEVFFPRFQLTIFEHWLSTDQGGKPLSEPMMFSLQTHIGVTWHQWVKETT